LLLQDALAAPFSSHLRRVHLLVPPRGVLQHREDQELHRELLHHQGQRAGDLRRQGPLLSQDASAAQSCVSLRMRVLEFN
jgi:hypothetical protein